MLCNDGIGIYPVRCKLVVVVGEEADDLLNEVVVCMVDDMN